MNSIHTGNGAWPDKIAHVTSLPPGSAVAKK